MDKSRLIFLDTAHRLLDLYRNRCDCMEIRLEKNERNFIQFEGKDLSSFSSKSEYGGNVRVYYRGGWGFISFNDLTRLEKFAEEAYNQAVLISSARKNDYLPLAPVSPCTKDIMTDILTDPAKVSVTDKLRQLENYNRQVLGFGPQIVSSRSTYFDQVTHRDLLTTDGVSISRSALDIGGSVIAIGRENDITQQYAVGFGSSNDYAVFLNLDDEIKEACETVVSLLRAPKVKPGSYPVICDHVLGGVFVHEAFGHLSEADSTAENKKLREIMQIGRQFGQDHLNIYDTGLTLGARGYTPYDDEGVEGTKQYLVKNGRLCGRLHSRETAAKMGEQATGSARCISYRYPPICRMRNTVIEQGNSSFEDMIKDINLGVYAVKSKGGQTNGEMFSFAASKGYMIRNGKIAEMVRDVNLSGNVFTTLANIDMIGNDQTLRDSGGGCGKNDQFPLPVSHESPHIRIQNVVVGGE